MLKVRIVASSDGRFKIAANEQGLLLWRAFVERPARTAAWFCFIVEDKIYCLVMFVKPGTAADV